MIDVVRWWRAVVDVVSGRQVADVGEVARGESGAVTILAVTGREEDRQTLARLGARANWEMQVTDSCEDAVRCLAQRRFGLILCDRDLPGMDWQDALEILVQSSPNSCVFLVSPVNDDYLWQEVIQRGGYEVLARPFEEEAVVHKVGHAWWYWRTSWGAERVAGKRR